MTLKPKSKKKKDGELRPLTKSAMKRASNKAILSFRKEITFSQCPKCKLKTLAKIGDHKVRINCED